MKFNFKSIFSGFLALTLILGSISCVFTGISVFAETAEKIVFTDDFNREDTVLSSIENNGDGYGVGNGWQEGTYGGANISGGKLILSAAGNMASKKYQSHRLMRPDSEATLNQSVSITIDTSEISSKSMPVLWLRLQPKTWDRSAATGYFVYTNGTQVYFAKSVDGTYSGISSPYCSFGSIAQGDVTITFTTTQKDTTTTTLSYAVSGVKADGTEFNYNWLAYDDTTAELQSAGNVGLGFINAENGTMAINNFTYTTTDMAPVPVVTDNFLCDTLNADWSATKDGILSLENGSMAIGFNGSYDSNSKVNNRALYNSSAISQFTEAYVPVSDIDNMSVAGEGASYPVLWLRDQTVNDAQIGYYMDYSGTGLSINRRNADGTATTIASSSYFVLNGSNTYAADSNVIFQFSAKGTNPTVLTARIYARYNDTQEQPSLVCGITATDSDESLEIETAGVPSIGIRRTTTDVLPLHIEKFVYYSYGALDYSSLNNAIASAESIIEKSEEYKAESISGLEAAIATAKAVLTASGTSQNDVNNAADTLQAEISKAVRFPAVKNIEVNGISATSGENNTFSVELSATCKTADFSVETTFQDGVTVTVSDGTNVGNSLSFTENEKSYTVTVLYNGGSESYTVNAVRGTKYTVVAKAYENGSITNSGVSYVENGSNMSFTVTPDSNYCVKSLLINGAETTLSADNIIEINNIEADYIIEVEFEKLLVMCDGATVSFSKNGGMRFSADVSENGIAHLEAQKKAGIIADYTIGTVMLPTDLSGDNELTLSSEKVLDIERTVWQIAVTDGYSRMTAVLSNIYHKNYEREIMARTYVTVTDKNGNENTTYSDVTSATVYNTAKETLAGDIYTGEYFNILNDFANPSQKAFTNAQKLLETEKKLTIGYIGGSITLGVHNSYGYDEATSSFSATTSGGDLSKSWVNQTSNWFKTRYPDATIETVNAGVSDTATNYGLFRLEKTLMNTNGHDMPDLVFVEFTVNDWIYDTQTASDLETQIESIFRNIYALNPYAEIAVVVTARSEGVQSRLCYKKVAENYGIPVIDMGIYLNEAINDRISTPNESAGKYYYTTDNLHPSMYGSEIYFAQIKKYLDTNCTTYTMNDSALYSYKDNIATALKSNLISNPDIISAVDEKLSVSGSAEESAVGIGCRMYGTDYEVETVSLLDSSYKITGETTFTFKFNGTALGLLFQMTTSSINATYSIDGAEVKTFAVDDDHFSFQRYAGHAQMWMLEHNLSDTEHTLTITFNDTTDMTVYFAGLLVNSK